MKYKIKSNIIAAAWVVFCSTVLISVAEDQMTVQSKTEQSKKKMDKMPPVGPVRAKYHILIQTEKTNISSTYDNDDQIIMTPSKICGEIFIFVNGEPVNTIFCGGKLFCIEVLCRSGKNIIELKGKLKLPMYVKIIEFEKAINDNIEMRATPFKVITKARLDQEKEINTVEFEVNSEIVTHSSFDVELEELDTSDAGKETLKKELLANLRQQLQALRRHDVDELVRIQSGGLYDRLSDMEGYEHPIFQMTCVNPIKAVSSKWPEDSYLDDMVFVFGKKSVFVYHKTAMELARKKTMTFMYFAEIAHMKKIHFWAKKVRITHVTYHWISL